LEAAHLKANEEQRHCVIDVSIQQAPIEEAGCRFFVEEWQWLLEDAMERLSSFRWTPEDAAARCQ
jgi:hypothetical protein